MILVTGGASFIGSNFVLNWPGEDAGTVINLDKATSACNLSSLETGRNDECRVFVQGEIRYTSLVEKLLPDHKPHTILPFASKRHIEPSIHSPAEFLETTAHSRLAFLKVARSYCAKPEAMESSTAFHHLHVLKDEIYRSLSPFDSRFSKINAYESDRPYLASRMASDLLVSPYLHTYGSLPLLNNRLNNYNCEIS
jgi:dTDP-glucose 4,6-dehydratase